MRSDSIDSLSQVEGVGGGVASLALEAFAGEADRIEDVAGADFVGDGSEMPCGGGGFGHGSSEGRGSEKQVEETRGSEPGTIVTSNGSRHGRAAESPQHEASPRRLSRRPIRIRTAGAG
jgi:hypothetical protein